jgi:predicted  nucleic acid-binding Zn-ribbon protein
LQIEWQRKQNNKTQNKKVSSIKATRVDQITMSALQEHNPNQRRNAIAAAEQPLSSLAPTAGTPAAAANLKLLEDICEKIAFAETTIGNFDTSKNSDDNMMVLQLLLDKFLEPLCHLEKENAWVITSESVHFRSIVKKLREETNTTASFVNLLKGISSSIDRYLATHQENMKCDSLLDRSSNNSDKKQMAPPAAVVVGILSSQPTKSSGGGGTTMKTPMGHTSSSSRSGCSSSTPETLLNSFTRVLRHQLQSWEAKLYAMMKSLSPENSIDLTIVSLARSIRASVQTGIDNKKLNQINEVVIVQSDILKYALEEAKANRDFENKIVGRMHLMLGQEVVSIRQQIQGTSMNIKASVDALNANLNNRYDSLDAKVTTLNTKLDTKVTALDNKVTALDTKVTALDTKVTELDNKVTALDTKVTTLDTKVTELDNKVTALDTKVTTLDTKLSSLDNRVSAMETSLNTKISTLDDKLNIILHMMQSASSSTPPRPALIERS